MIKMKVMIYNSKGQVEHSMIETMDDFSVPATSMAWSPEGKWTGKWTEKRISPTDSNNSELESIDENLWWFQAERYGKRNMAPQNVDDFK